MPDVTAFENIFWSFHREEPASKAGLFSPTNNFEDKYETNNESWIEWKIIWEASRYVIANRLRTTLGSAKDTINTIALAINQYDLELQGQSKPFELVDLYRLQHDNEEEDPEEEDREKINITEIKFQVVRPLLLLQFIENLEKIFYSQTISFDASPVFPIEKADVKSEFLEDFEINNVSII